MKCLFTSIVCIVISLNIHAQIIETNSSSVPTTIGSFNKALGSQAYLSQTINLRDTIYTLRFKSYGDKDFNTISFNEEGGTLNSLYKILISFFYPENKKNNSYKRTFKLGNEDITCTISTVGNLSVVFSTNHGFFLMTEKQCGKLFGK